MRHSIISALAAAIFIAFGLASSAQTDSDTIKPRENRRYLINRLSDAIAVFSAPDHYKLAIFRMADSFMLCGPNNLAVVGHIDATDETIVLKFSQNTANVIDGEPNSGIKKDVVFTFENDSTLVLTENCNDNLKLPESWHVQNVTIGPNFINNDLLFIKRRMDRINDSTFYKLGPSTKLWPRQ